ncbi:alpha/beta fold hydrolase [Alteromonas sp. AMM-1]|uniref:alpha/beta fold hydrolase n=1 Tax=Alteromonas sp. AMM-1 TaxID=3394233 RepID=UPI0039A4A3CD
MTVLFLPGTLCDERVWFPVWKKLPAMQRCYVPLQWANTLQDMLALTSDRVPDGEKVHLVGYSMGGYIAVLWALTYPEKVSSLTLLGYSPLGLTDEETARRKQLLAVLKQGKFSSRQSQYLANMIIPDKRDSLLPVISDMADDLGGATLLAHVSSTTPRKDLTSQLSALGVQVHLIAADADAVVSLPSIQRAANNLPKATLSILKHCGHMMLIEQPEEVASLIVKGLPI